MRNLVRVVAVQCQLVLMGIAAEITKNKAKMMNYTNPFREITQKYSVELVGWPTTTLKFANPSELGSQVPPLEKLITALKTGECRFVQLTPQQICDCLQERESAIEAGTMPAPKERKTRSDAGKKRKRASDDDGVQGSGGRITGNDGVQGGGSEKTGNEGGDGREDGVEGAVTAPPPKKGRGRAKKGEAGPSTAKKVTKKPSRKSNRKSNRVVSPAVVEENE